jgi:hypothetical protein
MSIISCNWLKDEAAIKVRDKQVLYPERVTIGSSGKMSATPFDAKYSAVKSSKSRGGGAHEEPYLNMSACRAIKYLYLTHTITLTCG